MVCRTPEEEPAAAIGVDTEHKGDALSAQVRSECLGGRRGERCCGRDVLSWDGGFTGELHVSHAARSRIEHWRERIEDWRERIEHWRERKNKTPRADDVRWQIEKRGRWWMDGRSAASACETRHTLSTMLPHEPPNTSRSAATWLKVCALAHEVTPRTAASSKRWRSSVTVRAVAALSAAAIRPAVTAFPVQPRSEASTTQRASARDAMAVSADFCTYSGHLRF